MIHLLLTELKRLPKRALFSGILIICLYSMKLQASSQATNGEVSVLTYGADPTGSADSTTAIQSASTAAGTLHAALRIPGGTYKVSKPIEVQTSVLMDATTIIKASVSMPAVLRIGSSSPVSDAFLSGGKIEANNLADDGIIFRQYQHLRIENTIVSDALVNGFHFGDSSLPSISYEAIATGIYTKRGSGVLQAGSAGLFIDSNASDGNFAQGVFVGSNVGVKVLSGGNFFTDIHVWSAPSSGWMTVGFDDYGTGNFWKGCEADTVRAYGLRAHRFNTSVEGCRFYNNNTSGLDNAMTGIHFDQTMPGATVLGTLFFGVDSSHRLAADITGASAGVATSGNQPVNVVLISTINSSLNGQLIVNGSLSSNSFMYGRSFTALASAATASQNTTTSLSLGAGWFNSSTGSASAYSWNFSPSQNTQGTPTSADLFLYTNGNLPAGVNPRLILGASAAQSSHPQVSSTQQVFQASYLNGKNANYDSWGIQSSVAAGSNPKSTLAFSHWGSSGEASVSVPALTLHGDLMSAAPRLTWTPFGNCSTNVLNCQQSSLWKPSRGITITQWAFSLMTPPKGCSYYPLLSLMKGTTVLASVKLSSGAINYVGGRNFSFSVDASDDAIAIKVTAAGTGCSVNAAGVSSTVEYVMQ